MSENKIGKRMVRWSVLLFYCFVVGIVFLLFPILFYKCPDILFGFDVLLFPDMDDPRAVSASGTGRNENGRRGKKRAVAALRASSFA